MDYQKTALRVLFYSLGIAALAGILAMILPNAGSVIGRLLGTAIATAIASLLLLISIKRLEVQRTRLFGGGLGLLVLIVYLCTICSVWVGLIFPPSTFHLEEKFGLSALLFAGCGSLILVGLLIVGIRKLTLAGYVLAAIWATSILTWLFVIWIFRAAAFEEFAEYFILPLQTLFPLLVLASIRRHVAYMVIALSLAISCCVSTQIAMYLTNGHVERHESLFTFMLITGGLAAFLGVLNVIQFRKQAYAVLWAERIILVVIGITIFVLCVSIWYEMNRIKLPDVLTRLAVGMGILSSTSIIGLLVWQMLRSSVFTQYDGIGLQGICPRCETHLEIPKGKSFCPSCGLRMKLLIESTACRGCGYDITKTPESDSCPECGEPILLATALQ